ncbi:hypothetical protein HpMS19_02160 [Helicobacter pylori]
MGLGGFSFGFVGELFQNTPISLWVLKIPFFKKLKNVNANKLIHMGATLKIFEIFPRLVRRVWVSLCVPNGFYRV